ncbi:MAG: M20/M25/M40 family metallo-hydrolase [Clostridia bacterium]
MSFETVKENKKESAQFMSDEITHIIKTFGKRDPGSDGEKKAVDYMAERCREYGCDKVEVESFKLHPAAFMGWIYITISLMLAAFALTFVPAIWAKVVGLVLIVIGLIPMIGEFILYKKVVDKLFKEKTSHNLTATKKPTGEIKRRIFFNGHPDAANEWTVNYHFGGIAFGAHFVISVLGLVYTTAVLIAQFFITPSVAMILACIAIIFVPFWVGLFFLWNERRVVDGANDNLTGCYMGISLLKALKESGIELENTEVGVLLTGSEEAGLRGAKAWCEKHKDDYKDVETLVISYDTIHEAKFLSVNAKDLNNMVAADKTASDLFKNSADKIGVTCGIGSVPFGATDSAAFNQAGVKATGITAMDHNLQDYYHIRRDTYDNLDLDCLADCFAVTAEVLNSYENQ